MSYPVYTVENLGATFRNHVWLFVETQPELDGAGQIFHVMGNISRGMMYQTRPEKKPESSFTFVPGSQKYVGRIAAADMGKLEGLCESVPPPGAQMNKDGSLKDPSKPVRRCGEWVDEVKEMALTKGLITA